MKKNNTSKKISIYLILFIIFWQLLNLYSFSQQDLNLTLYDFPYIREILGVIQNIGFYYRPLSLTLFLIISISLLTSYLLLLSYLNKLDNKKLISVLLIISFTGLFAYPLFSHDIFNYLFNAKMVIVYNANPHIQTASEFLFDPWTRFMRNVHTPAPYFYGWTLVSLLPVAISLPSFTLSLLLMKFFIISFFFLEGYLIYLISSILFPPTKKVRTWAFLLNPLLLTETVIVGHNDSVMMALALFSVLMLLKYQTQPKKIYLIASLLSFISSVSIKIATLILFPFALFIKKIDFFTLGGIALLLIILTRPGQIHSWYLHWGFSFLALSKYKWSQALVLLLTFGSLIRYAPFIYYGHWDAPVPLFRTLILFIPLLLLMFSSFRKNIYLHLRTSNL